MKSVEQALLGPANEVVNRAAAELSPEANQTDARLTVLEGIASAVGGWTLDEFWGATARNEATARAVPERWVGDILASISATPIPVPLALCALSREIVSAPTQRKTGAYYTDWRLAKMLAASSVSSVVTDGPWIDSACGTGTLLVAAAMELPEGDHRDTVIRAKLVGADLSPRALRGALLSVASLTRDASAIRGFASRLFVQDSLRSAAMWDDLAPSGAALVIGNPPWEKLKVSRHEIAKSHGTTRSYGQGFDAEVDLAQDRKALLNYVEQVAQGTRLQGKGELDLYKLFLELGIGITAEDGVLALLLPAGLVRSQGTEYLRRELDSVARELSISILENRARHFAIDTRFKFLALTACIGKGAREPIALRVADRTGTLPNSPVKIDRSLLMEVRGGLSVPEVRTPDEWDLYVRLAKSATRVGDPEGPWRPKYRREVDMTLDRNSFRRSPGEGALPLLEGRHVAQYRWRAKSYEAGEGRSASWRPEPISHAQLSVQWHVPVSSMNAATAQRTMRSRIGFCDITGQTNERSLLAARIPPDVVCGNKVPTISFDGGGEAREDLFLALANSLVVDWMLRRTVTTTVNFFLLDSLPLPNIDERSGVGRELVSIARLLTAAEGDTSADARQIGRWRARSDALVAAAWGIVCSDLEIVLRDFPLLDRGQPPLESEKRSTVTADLVLAELANILDVAHPSADRCDNALRAGAIPYVPAEFA